MLPAWAAIAANLGFYAYLLWVAVWFYRIGEGKERVLVAGWSIGIFVGPILNLISTSAAVDHTQVVCDAVTFAANVMAFVAAVYICKIFARDYPPTGNQGSRNDLG